MAPSRVLGSIGSPGASFRTGGDLLEKLIADGAIHEQAGTGGADLALSVEDACRRTADRGVEVGIRKDDVRRLAAELEREPLQRRGGAAHDLPPGRRLAGEGDLVDAAVRDDHLAESRSGTRQDVENTRRQPHFGGGLRQRQSGERRLARRFDDDGVATR
jgi:hypothetical protein